MNPNQFDLLLQFFKVLANESRLKILGLLANREWSVSELAAFLEVKEPTVSHHLAVMKELDLVEVRAEGNNRIYRLNARAVEKMSRDVFSQERLAGLVEYANQDDWERKVLQAFIVDGRLKAIPERLKKRQVVLHWLAQHFEPDRRYPERELNELLKQYHPDHASLRRYLVDEGLMRRENNIYWRVG